MYHWIAKYRDGTTVKQYNDGVEVSSDRIDRKQVEEMTILNDDTPLLTLHLDPGQRIIYRRRVEKSPGMEDIVCHLLGWQQTIRGENVQSIAYIFESGQTHLAGKFREDHPWFYSPILRQHEVND